MLAKKFILEDLINNRELPEEIVFTLLELDRKYCPVPTGKLQYEAQLTDTPIFAFFDEMSVNSQVSVKFINFENWIFWRKIYQNFGTFGKYDIS